MNSVITSYYKTITLVIFILNCTFDFCILIFRYLFALQIKRDLSTGSMPCQEHTAVLLASYIVQCKYNTINVTQFIHKVIILCRGHKVFHPCVFSWDWWLCGRRVCGPLISCQSQAVAQPNRGARYQDNGAPQRTCVSCSGWIWGEFISAK